MTSSKYYVLALHAIATRINPCLLPTPIRVSVLQSYPSRPTSTMEDYAACPPRERDRDLDNSGEHISISGDGERLHGTEYSYNDVSVRSSLDLSLRYPEDPHVSTPPSTHDQSTQIAALPQTNAAPSPRKGKMVQHLKSGYATWKTTWRLQTVIVGFYVLGRRKLKNCEWQNG